MKEKTMDISELSVGMKVCIVDETLNCGSPEDISIAVTNPNTPFGKLAIVVAIQDLETHPGKWIALCLKEAWEFAHECDGLVPLKHGWWSRPEYLYTPEEMADHETMTESWREQKTAALAIAAQFLAGG